MRKNFRRLYVCAIFLTSMSYGLTAVAAGTPITVTVSNPSTNTSINSTFTGLSYEKSKMSSHAFSTSNTAFLTLLKRLGPSVIRIGGNSVDRTQWDPTGPGSVSGKVSPADVDRFAAFVKAAGWKVIYGVNYKTSTPASAASEAKYVANALGNSLSSFEIGNEPDIYKIGVATFEKGWENFHSAMLASVPNAIFSGPASAYNYSNFTIPFAKVEGSHISLLTQHYYRGNGKSSTATVDFLLSPNPKLITELKSLWAAANANHIAGGYRLTEANSFYNGGAPGVSNTLGAALWTIDFLFQNAMNGSTGVNFHGGGSPYSPLLDSNGTITKVQPVYYGMYVFSMAANGTLMNTSISNSSVSLSTYAVKGSNGSIYVILNNKDKTQAFNVTMAFPSAFTQGEAMLLTAPSLTSTSGTTLGGAAIANNGSWTPTSKIQVMLTGNNWTINIPAGSAEFITMH